MKLDLNYIFLNIGASVRIMLGDVQGLTEIDRSASGFWRSFVALALALPFTLSAKYSEYNSAVNSTNKEHLTTFISWPVIQAITSVLAYFLMLVVFYAMVRSTRLEVRFPQSVVALNWSGLALSIISFPVVLLMIWTADTNPVLPFVAILLMLVFAAAMFNILRLTLQISPRPAIQYVLVLSVFEIIVYFILLKLAII